MADFIFSFILFTFSCCIWIFNINNIWHNKIPVWENKRVTPQNLSQHLRKAYIKDEHAETLENFTKLCTIFPVKDLGQQLELGWTCR